MPQRIHTAAASALHLSMHSKYFGIRSSGMLVGDSAPSQGKTSAWADPASTKKSVVKAPKAEVAKNFIVETSRKF